MEADLTAWQPDAPGDVVYSNATFQWLDDHHDLLPRVVEAVKPGGVLAIQVPNNWREPSHVSMAETAKNGPWRDRVVPILRELPVLMPHEYYAILRPMVSYLNIWGDHIPPTAGRRRPHSRMDAGSRCARSSTR